jgi:predicted RND superfamily exporter protein
LSQIALRWPAWASAAGVALAIAGAYFTFLLYRDLRTDIEELLPTTARSVIDLHRLGSQVKSVENLVVLVFSKDTPASKRFVVDLAQRLQRLPSSLVAGIDYKIDAERDFFRKRRALFLELPDLEKLRDYLHARLLYEKDRLGLGLGLAPEPKLDGKALEAKYASRASLVDRFPDGFYATPDQTKRALIVNLPGRAADIDAALGLKTAVEQTVAALNPHSYSPDLEVRYTGNTENLIEEHAALIADLKFSTAVVILLVAGAMLLFFRDGWATFALVLSVIAGTLWTMGLSYFLAGYLNANSAFLASIVIGNGINFGIILLARYLEERRHHRGHRRSLITAVRTTYKPTLVAALAAGISYGSLMLTSFRGFSQFGIIGLCGMLLCWASAYALLPSLLTVIETRRRAAAWKAITPRPVPQRGLACLIERRPRAIALLALVLTVGALATPFFHRSPLLELDMNKLRDRASMRSGSGFYYHYIAEIFGKNLSPMVLLTPSRADARRAAAALRAEKQKEGTASQIAWVQSLDDLIPTEQPQKIAVLQAMRRDLTPAVLKALPADYRNLGQEVIDGAALQPFGDADLPSSLVGRFTPEKGERGSIVLVDKPVVEAGQEENALVTVGFIRELRAVVDAAAPGSAIAGQLPITADMVSAVMRDGPRATFFAWAAVFLLVVLLFRNVRLIALVSFTLWVGIIWFAGAILGLSLKINFLNFIALPITFGIGVDYGVNIFQRYREDGMHSVLDTVRHTGAAVALCSLTTVIGYSSLILAGNQAFVSFGALAVLGEICCVTVAVIFLPACLLTRGSNPTVAAAGGMDKVAGKILKSA